MGRRLAELAELIAGRVVGDSERVVEGIRTLDNAGPNDLTFVTPAYRERAGSSRAGAFLVGEKDVDFEGDLLVAPDPRHALSTLLGLFHPAPAPAAGIHSTAVVDPSATVDPAASLEAYVVVGAGSTIAAGAHLYPHVVIGRNCRIGEGATLHPHSVLYDESRVGARSIIHAGAVVGSDGYGYATSGSTHVKLNHVGAAVIEEDVEVGANCAIDRALLEETRIGAGTKIDNLVQVGHNADIGRSCLLVSQVGISGSTRLGDGVVMAGQSGVAGHLTIGDGGRVAAKSAVFKSVSPGQTVAGVPAIEAGRWRRIQALLNRLADMRKRLVNLERRLPEGESKVQGNERDE